jgi:hypothetical protein
MSSDTPDDPNNPRPIPNDQGTYSQAFSHEPVGARVPDRVAKGVFSTGVLVLDSPTEFVLDFLQGLTRPFAIVARVVVPPAVMNQLIGAANDNLGKFTATFGPPHELPKPPGRGPTLQEIYENFKIADELLSGHYANSVMIGHNASEFFFDFITGFYPHAAVSSRVFISAPQMPRVINTLTMAFNQYQKRWEQPPEPPAPPPQS